MKSIFNQIIGVIGAGNMGSAIYHSLMKLMPRENVILCDKDHKALEHFEGAKTSSNVLHTIQSSTVIFLSIKPKVFDDIIKNCGNMLEDKCIISVMAGVTLDRLQKQSGSRRIIRAMPNLPIQVEKGVIGWICKEGFLEEEKKEIKKIFSTMGMGLEVTKEEMLDSITAIAGSGPAYFFYLCEMLENKAKALGFHADEAKKLAKQTFIGAASLLEMSQKEACKWREAVTSKGGTTEAALHYLKEHSFEKIFNEAVDQAKKQAEVL